MNIILRHVVTGVLYSLFLSIVIAGIIFIAFPLDDWSVLLKQHIYNFPFIWFLLIIPILIGIVSGISTGWYWRQRLHQIHRQLNDVVKGQKATSNEEVFSENLFIQNAILQVEDKFNKQIELSQRQATERAEEREKGLQEVVLQERNRLARELHDSVSQQLFAASMMMSAINETQPSDDENSKKQLTMVENMIHQSQLEMRALLLHLRPIALKGKTLQEGIQELLKELSEKIPIEIGWKIEAFQVAKGVEDQLFRILQESVSNTLRHAQATTIHVMLIERDDNIILRAVDNGIGFDMERVNTSSYGLENMKERAYEIGGTFKVVSLPNQGTRLEVKVPQFKNEDEADD